MAKEKKIKFYNQYPFPVRVINDLKKAQVLAPQGHGKVFRNEYDQSKLNLIVWDKSKEQLYKPGLEIDLDTLLKKDLVDLAWAVMFADDKKELSEMLTKKQLIKAIREKVGEEEVEEEVEEVAERRPEISTDDAPDDEPEQYKDLVNSPSHGD